MFKIKIEEEFNTGSEMIRKWFVKYDSDNDRPLFSDKEEEGGVFVIDMDHKDALMGNLMALYDRFGYKGTPIPLDK